MENSEILLQVQQSALIEIAKIAAPWSMRQNIKVPYPIKIVNETVASIHVACRINDNGIIELIVKNRVRDPGSNVLVIEPDDDKTIEFDDET